MVENETGAIEPKKNEINADSSELTISNNTQIVANNELFLNGVYCFKGRDIRSFEEWFKVFKFNIRSWDITQNDVKIADIVNLVQKFHKGNGGEGTCGKKWFREKILPTLLSNKIINELGSGTRTRYVYDSAFLESVKNQNDIKIVPPKSATPNKLNKLTPVHSIKYDGEEQEVYVMYFKYSEFNPELKGKFWRCKIGRTENKEGLRSRINETSFLPDKICYSLRILTSDSKNLEKAIHEYLKQLGRQVSTYGTEWFFTNPDEIMSWFRTHEMIYRFSKLNGHDPIP